MILTVEERVIISNLLSQYRGDITTVRIVHELRMALSFSEKERKALQFRPSGSGDIQWKVAAAKPKNIVIGESALKIISDSFKAQSRKGLLAESHIPIYDRFVKEEPTKEVPTKKD